MLSNYIKSLIDIHSRVIVPDLGAFMLKGDSSKAIYFNEFLRFNDGLLVDYIADKEQIDKIEAAKKVKLFVDTVNKQLLGNKSVELEGLGTLYLDINEKIQLKTSDASSASPVNQPEPAVETTPREILFELEKTEPEVNAPKVQATPPPVPPPPPASTPKPKVEPQAPTVKESTPPPVDKSKQIVTPPVKDKEQSKEKEIVIDVVPTTTIRMVVVGVFGVLMIAAIVYFAFIRAPKANVNANQDISIGADNKKDSATLKDSTVKPENKAVANKPDTKVAKDTKHKEPVKSQVPAPVTENKAKPSKVQKSETPKVTAKSASGKKFYVVAGTFSLEGNADRMVKKLKDEGYSPDKLRNDKKNVFYVSYSSFGDKESAQAEMKKLKSSGKTDSWIYAY